MANGGIIGPNNPVGKIGKTITSVFMETGTLTTGACTTQANIIVQAGGAGGGYTYGGGGGAGGYRTLSCQALCASTSYAITIGAGGAGSTAPASSGSAGSLS